MKFNFLKTLRSRLMLTGVSLTTIPMLLVAIITFFQGNSAMKVAEIESRTLANEDLKHIVEGVYAMVASQQEVLQQKVVCDLNVAENELNALGKVRFSKNKVEWKVRNQYTKDIKTMELPQMLIGQTPVEYNPDLNKTSPLVDKVKKMIGGTCTVFQRMNENGDMLRISLQTSKLKKVRAPSAPISRQ
jgi:methyl-accepting chemotaxis protein